MASEEEIARPEQVVGGLLRLAGPRVPPPEERAGRVYTVVHAEWRRAVRARRLRRAALWTGLAATAAACAAWVALDLPDPRTREASVAPAPVALPAARVERLSGDVRLPASAAKGATLAAGDEIAHGALLEAGRGRAALRLHGGSSLRVDVDTRLRLVSAAEVLLEQGAVYVDSHPAGQPAAVTVRTRLGSVREMGTQFEVRLAPDTLRVRVREGRIGLDQGRGAAEGSRGEELSLQNGRVSRRPVPTHGPEWAWVQQIAPAFELEGRSLGAFLAWVSRETGRPVRFAEGGAEGAATRLHGSIDGLTPEEALSAVLPTCGRTHWYSRGAIVVGGPVGGAAASGRSIP